MRIADAPLAPFGQTLLNLEIETNLVHKPALISQMVNFLVAHGYIPLDGRGKAELCFDEALVNAMQHGNQMDRKKKVRIAVCVDGQQWGALIEDEGEGFDPRSLPDVASEEGLLGESGRGVYLMNRYADDLIYSPKGNQVLIRRKRRTSEPPTAVSQRPAAAAPAAPAAEVETVGPTRVWAEAGASIVEVTAAKLSEQNLTGLKQAFEFAPGLGPRVVVDLGAVNYLSSVVIGALVQYFKRAKDDGGVLLLCRLQPGILDTLKTAHMDRLFPMAPGRVEAVAALNAAKK
ncbi:MAG: ATP-binding protein [Planctomycetes bacterium]|nr:ATP-binding protein [Planctomycetota bacterium]